MASKITKLRENVMNVFCSKCSGEFETEFVVAFNQKIYGKVCPACINRTNAEAQTERDTARKTALEAAWIKICPPSYRLTDVNHPKIQHNKEALAKIMRWKDQEDGKGMRLIGPSGLCKTRMLFLKLRELHMSGRNVFYVTAVAFARACGNLFNDDREIKGEAVELMKKVRSCEILLLDDLGKEKYTERVETEMYDLIENRTSFLRPIFWTANLDSDKLASQISEDRAEPIIRRLADFSHPIHLKPLED